VNSRINTHLAVDEAVRLMFADPEWNFKLGIGCLINGGACALLLVNIILLPISFCLWSLVAGYVIMTTNAKVDNPHSKLPVWTNYLDLLIGGGIWIAVSVLHFAIFLLIVFLSLLIGAMTGLDNVLTVTFLFWALATWTFVILAAAAFSFTSLFLMVNFATKQNIAAAFAIKEVFNKLRRQPKRMLEAWLIQLGLLYVATIIPVLTVLGVFLLPSTIFFAQLIGCCILSQAWRESDQKEDG